jgi:hypothetical protein
LTAAEGLSGSLFGKKNRHSSHFHCVKTSPTVSHVLFAYDNLLFIKANEEGASKVKDLLDIVKPHASM